MKSTLALVVGDWSNDGHGRSETFIVQTYYPERFPDAIRQSVASLGLPASGNPWDFIKACSHYEYSEIPREWLEHLIEHGFDLGEDEFETYSYALEHGEYPGETVSLNPKEWAMIHVFLANLADHTLRAEILDHPPTVQVGGYGLFYG